MIFDRKLHRSHPELPDGFAESLTIDLQSDKKTAVAVNAAALVIGAVMFVAANFMLPFRTLYGDDQLSVVLLKLGVLIVAWVAYIILHELVHGAMMRYSGSKTVKYGFTGMYAFAGSSDFYDKASYIVITLAPVVFWGIVLVILNVVLPGGWFWVVYMIQIANVAGAAGDAYVTFRLIRMKKDILITDSGVSMKVYEKAGAEQTE